MALEDSAFVVVGVPTSDTPNARGLASDAVTDNIGILDHGAGNALQLTTEYNLKALAEVDSLGLVAYTGSHAFTPRTITSSGSIAVTNGNGQGGNPTLNVVDNTSTQRVNVTYGAEGTPVGTQSTLNFINGSNATVGLYNNIGQNRIDITVSATGGGGGGAGTVTEVDTGAGLVGGPFTTSGTISMEILHPEIEEYTNANITVDQYGRITEASNGSAGSSVSITAQEDTPIVVTPSPLTGEGTIGMAVIEELQGSYTNADITVDEFGRVIAAANGSSGGGGSVTGVTAGTGLQVGEGPGGTISTTGTLNLTNTGVGATSYTLTNLTVDAQGRITTAANGAAVTGVTAGTGLQVGDGSGSSTISATGTLNLTATGVSAASYSNANITVDAQGRITAASGGAFSINFINQSTPGSYTYTPSAGMQYVIVEIFGGGGSGGSSANTSSCGGGGGAGAYTKLVVTAAQIGASQPYQVGARGAASAGGANGNPGESSWLGEEGAGGLGTSLGGEGGFANGQGGFGGGSITGTVSARTSGLGGDGSASALIGGLIMRGPPGTRPGWGGGNGIEFYPDATVISEGTSAGGGWGTNNNLPSNVGGHGQLIFTEYCWVTTV